MIFLIKFVLVMVFMICTDVAWTFYTLSVGEKKAVLAGLWSSTIILCGSFVTISYVEDRRLLFAAILGAFIGTSCTIYYKNKKDATKSNSKL